VRSRLSLGLFTVALAAGCTQAPVPTTASSGPSGSSLVSNNATAPTSSSANPSPSLTPQPARRVHISVLQSDGASYGVGLPVIAWFDRKPTDARGLAAATTVTADGRPVEGGWYFEPTARAGAALEGHWRPRQYWPAHAKIHVDLPAKDISAGNGLVFDNDLTLDYSTTAAHIVTVEAHTLKLSVVSDGATWGTFPVSLGAPNTPTQRGTKVIMEKGRDISMRGPGYYDPHVAWTQRLTYAGEYLHAAPWNTANIGVRSTSNGCTNLTTADAKTLYDFLGIGDVVKYPDAPGPQMHLGQGYGDWNLSWAEWQTGGAVKL